MTASSSVLRHYVLAQVLAIIIALTAFVGHRNRKFVEGELLRVRVAAERVSEDRYAGMHVVLSGVVGAAEPSRRYPFLSRRTLRDGRVLGGPRATSDDKVLYDAAVRAEQSGGFAELLDDGARAIAAIPTEHGVAIAVTAAPADPAGVPWLGFFGLFVTGMLLSLAGALLSPRLRTSLLAIGGAGPAILAYSWGGLLPALAIVCCAIGVALLERRQALVSWVDILERHRAAYAFVLPTALAMSLLVIAPFFFGIALGFYDHHHGQWSFVGFDNFAEILSGGGRSLSDPLNFWFTLGVTVAWTVANVLLHVAIGIFVALGMSKSWIAGRGLFRVLLILPWAIPNYITALVWHGMFQGEYGAINGLLSAAGVGQVSWFSNFSTAFFANVCTNTWLGFPFMMVVALGALQTIPGALYEAAQVDGASSFQRFRHITLPHLWPAMVPAMTLGAIWTFNMFNVIYLVSDGQPGGSTDILVTEAYRWAFERGERYGLAAAYATIIFGILLLWTVFGTRLLSRDKTA